MRLLLILPLLTACTEHKLTPLGEDPVVPSPGALSGRVCDLERGTWLADAMVYTNVVEGGMIVETRSAWTDRDGRWSIDQLPGDRDYDVMIQHGLDDLGDQEVDDVFIASGEHVTLAEPACFDSLDVPIAVVTGDYDRLPEVLDAMGLDYDLVDGKDRAELVSFLVEPDGLFSYDLVLFEGGHIEAGVFYVGTDGDTTTPDAVADALRRFVEDEHTIFVTDWSYDVVEQVWPDRVDFAGDDDVPDAAQLGEYDLVKAAVSDQELAAWLDRDTLPLSYDLPVWAPVVDTDGSVSVHLTADVEYRVGQAVYSLPDTPLLLSFSSGEGRVVYSSFRVAENASAEMLLTMQYLLYGL